MAMIVLSSPATLTGAGEKKTGPSRFIADFFERINKIFKIQKLQACIRSGYSQFTRSRRPEYTEHTDGAQG